ncbi:MAG: hypothetical protein ACKPKO_55005 [Candidatus Fonsibacter sp.]
MSESESTPTTIEPTDMKPIEEAKAETTEPQQAEPDVVGKPKRKPKGAKGA